MSHIRIFNQPIYFPLLFLVLIEYGVLYLSVYLAVYLRFVDSSQDYYLLVRELSSRAHLYALVMSLCSLAMGVYNVYGREGLTGMMLRSLIAFALTGTIALSLMFYIFPSIEIYLGRGVLAIAVVSSWLTLVAVRYLFYSFIDTEMLRRRVLVLGTGKRAERIKNDFDRHSQQRRRYDFDLVGFVPSGGKQRITDSLIQVPVGELYHYCRDRHIGEILVAVDDRRKTSDSGFPLEELLDCKLSGISIIDELTFYERESLKLDTRLISAGWMVYANGFQFTPIRDRLERIMDIVLSLMLLVVALPIMLLTALAIKLEEGIRAPVFYSQERVGLNGKTFFLHKFRSMRTDAEKDGKAIWARENDDRVTRVGQFIRNTRIDELPQVLNVLRNQMSFVGPRPERPQFVDELAETIPFFKERHRVKPGLTGWAQLCYPYGASKEDSEQKLQYDLYYIKNHGLFFDIYILVRTVEVVLLGKGVR